MLKMKKLSLCLQLAGLTFAGTAIAKSSSVIDEIIVTAQKREQSLQDTPVSVTAFSGNALKDLNFTNSLDVASQTPGLNLGTPLGEGNNTSVVLRGVGINDFNDNNEANIAVYIDDVYYSFMAGQTFQLYDTERVEVLRGPQGTLYGRNATGGLIHYISKRPTAEFEGYSDLTLGSYNEVKYEGAVSGPLTDSIRGRASISTRKHDGYVENRVGPNRNEADSQAYRLQLEADASDSIRLLFNVHGVKSDTYAGASQAQQTVSQADVDATPGAAPFLPGFLDTDNDVWAGEWDRNALLTLDASGASAHVDWDINGDVSLVSITSYEQIERLYEEDSDNSALNRAQPTFFTDNDQFSQEFRLSGATANTNWVAGLYYFELNVNSPQDLGLGVDETGIAVGEPGSFFMDTEVKQETKSTSAFGQLEYRFNDQWQALAGLRLTQDQKEYDYIQVDRFGGVTGLGIADLVLLEFNSDTVGNLAKIDDTVTTGKIGINWTPNEDWLGFVNIARGFKSGGFNSGFVDPRNSAGELDLSLIPYEKEILDSIEIGAKSTWFDGSLKVNATAFYYDYQDQQILSFTGVASYISNGNSSLQGGEIEVQASPAQGLDIIFGMSFLDTEADGITLSDGSTSLEGVTLILSPEFTANGLVRYETSLGRGTISGQIAFNHQGAHYFDITNSPQSEEDGYTLYDASITYTFPNERFKLTAFGRNITNEEYKVYSFDFTSNFGINQVFYGPPAWYGVTARFTF